MQKQKTQMVALNALLACVYALLTILCSAFSYGGIQLRISEILVFLAFYNKKYIPGLLIGCLLANTVSPLGLSDMIFGTFATLLTCLVFYKMSYLFIGAFVGASLNGIIVGAQLYWIMNLPFALNACYVFLGEFLVLLIGAAIFKRLEKNETLMKKYILPDE